MNKIVHVLDHGYVRRRSFMDNDLEVVNAARVSFDRSAQWDGYFPGLRALLFEMFGSLILSPGIRRRLWRLRKDDKRLINYLAKHNHKLPFGHVMLKFECYAPLIVVRQWFKHIVGSAFIEEGQSYKSDDPLRYEMLEIMPASSTEAWNESSRRYVTENNQFYIPSVWRSVPANRKQGSGKPVPEELAKGYTELLEDYVGLGQRVYQDALNNGIAPEQARLLLPYGALYVRFIWTCSLLRVLEFLELREADDAQSEIREYANAVRQLSEPIFPESFEAWAKR